MNPAPAVTTAPKPHQAASIEQRAWIWVGWTLIAAIVVVALVAGWQVRRWAFDVAEPIRFSDDMNNAYFWGLTASGPEGYFNQYDKMANEVPEWQDQKWWPWLDYAPLRLLVVRQWAAWGRVQFPLSESAPRTEAWQRGYPFMSPMMEFNATLEVFSAVCMFFLVRLWVRRASRGEKHGHFHGTWQGLAAALAFWFSADVIISAHAWPQWDSWLIPWYLLACLAASLDWWFAAGAAIVVGAMFKGQMLSIAPIFIIWPLVQGRIGAAARWLLGAVFMTAVFASPWLITFLPPDKLAAARQVQETVAVRDYPADLFAIPRVFDVGAAVWIAEMLIIGAATPFLVRQLSEPVEGKPPWLPRAVLVPLGAVVLLAVVYWPWLAPQNRGMWPMGILAGALLAGATLYLSARSQPYVWAAVVGGGLLACMSLFHGGTGWWYCSFGFGAGHWPYLATGPVSNVPALFQDRFGWDARADQLAFTLPAVAWHWPSLFVSRQWWPAADWDVSAKTLFDSIYGVMLLICGVGIGLQARRNDRRVLVALVTPWIMFFLFPVQIQERYLFYAAAVAACCIGQSLGMALLGFLLMVCSAIMELNRMMNWRTADLDAFGQNLSNAFPSLFSPDCGRTMLQYFDGTHPGLAWGILIIALVFLYVSIVPTRKQATLL